MRLVFALAAALAIVASAPPVDAQRAEEAEPSIAAARVHFERGTALFAARDFAAAMREFASARALRPSPAFDYNIARCLEELGRDDEALAAYQAFAAHTLDAAAAAQVKERVAALRARGAHEPPPPVVTIAERPRRRAPVAASATMAAVAVALLATGGGLRGSVDPAYNDLRAQWDPGPRTVELQDQANALRRREIVGLALIGVGAVAAVVDLGLWIGWARSRR